MTDLGTLGGDYVQLWAVSDAGHVVGTSNVTVGGDDLAFRWTAGRGMEMLIDLGGNSTAYGVNDLGEVVGNAYDADRNYHAFYWNEDDGYVLLGDLGGGRSTAYYINEAGQVAGAALNDSGKVHAFLWPTEYGMLDLGTLGGATSAVRGLTEDGMVVGVSKTADGDTHAYVWTDGEGMVDLGTLGGSTSEALDVNEWGQVVGWSINSNGEQRAFSWTADGGMEDLGTLGDGSMAYAVNNEGQVAGLNRYATTPGPGWHPFLWTGAGGMQDLGNPHGTYATVVGLNDLGMITGNISREPSGNTGYLWTEDGGYQYLESASGDPTASVFPRVISDLGWIVGQSSDGAGGVTAVLWAVDVATTEDALDGAIEDVEDLVTAGTLKSGQGNALTSKLEAALAALEKGNTTAACNKVDAFVNQVEGLVTAGKLSSTEGDSLIDAVSDLGECT
jgi:probable HAF family extracellular repeat protein